MTDDFQLTLDADASGAKLVGVLRLSSPQAYRDVLQPISDALDAGPGEFRLDLAGVSFMNSSGVTALSRLIMSARQHGTRLLCVVDDEVSWQRKTLSSLQRLNPRLEIVKG